MEWNNATSAVGALAAGAAAMYLLDPQHGRRRRAVVRDKAVHTGHAVGDSASIVARDLAHRTQGIFAEQRSRLFQARHIPPERVEARARALLGRLVSHPHAVSIEASDGRLILAGYILEKEVQPLLQALRTVPGVQEVENRLEVGRHPEQMPSLQGGRPRPGILPDILQRRMAPSTRLILGIGAAALALYGLRRRDIAGGLMTAGGVLAGTRAATNLQFGKLLGRNGREAVRLQNAIEVDAPVEEVFDFFRHFENFPRFMQHIRQVRQGEGGVWHWEADGPLGIGVTWDGVVTRMQPNRRISWKSLPGSQVRNVGSVWFEPTFWGTTRVHIQMSYNPPAGAIGHTVASLLGADPVKQMDDDLVRFKSLIERGKTSAHGEQVVLEELEAG